MIKTYGALAADLDPLIEPLRHDHGLLHRKIQLARCILLQLAGDERGNRVAFLFAPMDSGNDERLLSKSLHDGIHGLLIGDIPLFPVERARFGGEFRRLLPQQARGKIPVLFRFEGADLLLALYNQPQCHRLHAPRRKTSPHFVPEERTDLVTYQAVENPTRQLSADLVPIDLPGILERFLNCVLGDFMEKNSIDLPFLLGVFGTG